MAVTLYWIVQADATATPTGAQIVAGQDGTGATALASGSEAYTAAGDYSEAISITGLSAGVAYEQAWVAYDGSTYSSVVTATITTVFLVSGAPATVTISPQSAQIVVGKVISTAPATVTLTGQPALVINNPYSPTIVGTTPASVSIIGSPAKISAGRTLKTTPATVSITASPASVISGVGAGTLLGTTPASVVLAASSAQIIVGKVLNTSPASLSVNGASALVTNSAITVYLRAGSWIRYIQL